MGSRLPDKSYFIFGQHSELALCNRRKPLISCQCLVLAVPQRAQRVNEKKKKKERKKETLKIWGKKLSLQEWRTTLFPYKKTKCCLKIMTMTYQTPKQKLLFATDSRFTKGKYMSKVVTYRKFSASDLLKCNKMGRVTSNFNILFVSAKDGLVKMFIS